MTNQKANSPANHSLKDLDFYKNLTNNVTGTSAGTSEGLSPSHDQADASALAAAAAAAHVHLNGTMQDMINLQKLQNLATLQHQHHQQQQQQHQQHQQHQHNHHQQTNSSSVVPTVAAALASLQGLAGISSAVALNSPLNLSIGSSTTSAAAASLSSSTGLTNNINNNKAHGPVGSTSTSSSSLPVSSLSVSTSVPMASSPPHGGEMGVGIRGSPVASNLIAGGCSPPAASAQMPQLILASGQLVQGVQGAQLLIPTAQGIAVQTILTIPVSQQINTSEQFAQNFGSGAFATPLPPSLPPQSLLKPNLFSNGVQQLLAALHPELFAAAAANHLATAADVHHHHQHHHAAAAAAAAAAAKSFHIQQFKQEQQRDQQSVAHRSGHQMSHLHHQHHLQQQQHQQHQLTENHHLSPKLEPGAIKSLQDCQSPSPPVRHYSSTSPCRRSPSMSPQPPVVNSQQSSLPLHLKQSPKRECPAGINLSHQQADKSPVSPVLMALSSGSSGGHCVSSSNHYSSSPLSTQLFRSHSPTSSQHLTSISTPSPSNMQHQSREQQQQQASTSSVLSSINRLTSTNGELTITKSHGPSTAQSSSSPSPHHQSSHHQQQQHQPNSHHPLHVGSHHQHQHLHPGGNSLKMSPSSSSSGMQQQQQQQQISPNGTDGSCTDLLVDSPNEQTINQATSNVVDGIDLDEIKEFAKAFKLRRLSLGLTQTQVGQALSVTEGPAYSQSAICSALAAQMYAAQLSSQQQNMFEKLDITPKSAQKIKPVLERWMKEAEESHWNRYKTGQNHLTDYIGVEPSKKRKRRTSFTPQALELLNAHFERNTHPSGTEITGLAHQLGYEREVIRIWFCNKRQALKNTVRMMSKGMV